MDRLFVRFSLDKEIPTCVAREREGEERERERERETHGSI
jgi:hypothetical protein